MKALRIGCLLVILSNLSFCVSASDQGGATLSSLPIAGQSSISNALGRDIAANHIRSAREGFVAANPKQHFRVHFTSKGVEVQDGNLRWGSALRGYGYGNALKRVEAADPQAISNRVEYQHGALTEWYVNGPVGLEQGFTIQEPPSNPQGQPLTVMLALSGDLNATVDKGRKDLHFASCDGKVCLRYVGMSAYDASGAVLRAWLDVKGERLLLQVEDTGARYPS